MYKLMRNVLFWFDAEKVHYFSMNTFKALCNIPFIRKTLYNICKPSGKNLQVNLLGLTFSNPVGLAAGFDKNAKYMRELSVMGFGFIEIGTVTPLPQKGNPTPRLFRLKKDKALINRMGFNNDGAIVIQERLKKFREDNQNSTIIIGGNIGKNKNTVNEDAWKDYETCFNILHDYVDYFVVNVSSPNTPGLRDLQQKDFLKKILTSLQGLNTSKKKPKPLLLKISPDLLQAELEDIITLAMQIKLDGLVAANTTIKRGNLSLAKEKIDSLGAGGLSGKPLSQEATFVTRFIAEKTSGAIPVISSGGIFTGNDAKEKFIAGASLVQVWTGFIYEGPSIVKNICNYLSPAEINN